MRPLVRDAPPGLWLALLVSASFALLVVQALAVVHPFAYVDELIYSTAAKRIAHGESPAPPEAGYGYGLVYVLLLAPVYRLAGHVPDAYPLVKVVNAAAFSLAAVPAYVLTRRVARPSLALGVAALTLALPARLYASLEMTECVAFLVFLVAVVAIVRCVEDPTAGRQAAVLLAIALAVETRRQNLVLMAALPLVILLATALETRGARRSLRRALRRFPVVWIALLIGVAAIATWSVARSASPAATLGPFDVLVDGYDVGSVAFWLRAHVGTLGLVLGVIPLVVLPFGLAVALRRAAGVSERALGATTAILVPLLLVQVALFASTPFGHEHVHERYLFYVAPLTFAVLALWIEKGRPGRSWLAVAAALVVLLPLLIPWSGVSRSGHVEAPVIDALGFDPAGTDGDGGLAGSFHAVAVILTACIAIWVLVLRPGRRGVLLVVTLAFFLTLDIDLQSEYEALGNGQRALAADGSRVPADWIDRATGTGSEVRILSVAPNPSCPTRGHDWRRTQARFQRAIFFNTRVGRVLAVGPRPSTGLHVERVQRVRDGVLVFRSWLPRGALVLAETTIPLEGRRIARDARAGLALWRVDGTLRTGMLDARGMRELVCLDAPP
jgi:hypothetical protein